MTTKKIIIALQQLQQIQGKGELLFIATNKK